MRALTGRAARAVVRVPMGMRVAIRARGLRRVELRDGTGHCEPARRWVRAVRAGGRIVPVLRQPPDGNNGLAVDVIRAMPRLVRHGRRQARGEVAGQQQRAGA
jgi:hypothetical protein